MDTNVTRPTDNTVNEQLGQALDERDQLQAQLAEARAEVERLRDCYEAERSYRLHSCDACGQVPKRKLCYVADRLFDEISAAQQAALAATPPSEAGPRGELSA